jgi:hypothetical protein
VRIPERALATLGEPAALTIAIAVDRGLVVSRDAPVIVDLGATGGITARKPRLGRADAVDPGADAPRFAVALKTTGLGEHVVKVRIRMWVCGGRVCRPVDTRRQATIAVRAPEPAPDPAPGPVPRR